MPEFESERAESYPSLTARRHWGKYAVGMGVEIAFIAGLTLIGFLLALAGVAIWG